MERRTVLSACRTYRYVLWRELDADKPGYALFIGLNPSTADEVVDDPTIRRCKDFARQSPSERHRLRIALKKLRYTAELFAGL